ncbi:P-loop containing nucleoside triphosphate hydrolase protein [Piptocephalis cylindrospora]|uniref:Ribosome assembly protein 1 n=1 Tax=Piptocephalis cylindrospora TaxID=1907219 RepID=A0A4P9Y7R1_9FUNG|nr:P-loop containing nucleoside triphosphate hydrolase protein [Piptocephalis cylindrospora]|eukprot:RKP15045.1 P-loop containing nucleoside triphosphate hydrolase protein [Piptocephalis cylindrospora]
MPAISPAQLAQLQQNARNVRNICIMAHVDHGKTTLSDSLLASNGVISSKLAGKVRYLDSREDEQERGITMESSAISLYFKTLRKATAEETIPSLIDEYLVNLIDSPGHVDFSGEVSTASRLCDGALILVDAVEGVCTQTHTVLRQAWQERVKPILVFNKIDRLILELRLSPMEAYHHLIRILEQVNAVTGKLWASDRIEEETRRHELAKARGNEEEQGTPSPGLKNEIQNEDVEDEKLYFSPEYGNVIFASAVDGWAFRIHQFASLYAKKLGMKEATLRKTLWGDYYLDPKTKRILQHKQLKNRNLKPMFVQFVLENIWSAYDTIVNSHDPIKIEKIVKALGVKILPRDLRSKDTRALVTTIFSQWLPLSSSVLLAVIDVLPSPVEAQALRMPFILRPAFKGPGQWPPDPTPLETSVYNCQSDPTQESEDRKEAVPVVAYISKMFSVPRDMLPQNRRRSITAEEMRERGREIRQARLAASAAAAAGSAALDRADSSSLDPGQELVKKEEEEEEEEEVLIGLSRIYSGTIRIGQQLQVLGPKYDPKTPHLHTHTITISSLYMVMGRELAALDAVPAGNIFGIGGLGSTVLKTATLTSSPLDCPSLGTLRMVSSPIVRVAIEPAHPSQGPQLARGLRLLSMADACVEVVMQETGEQVLLTVGEIHLERCLKDLRERFAKIEIHVSPPIVPFRETAVEPTEPDTPTFGEGEEAETKTGRSVVVTGVQGRYTLRLSAYPLPPRVRKYLQSQSLILKSIISDSGANRGLGRFEEERKDGTVDSSGTLGAGIVGDETADKSTLKTFKDGLKRAFSKSPDPEGIWGKDVVERIWSFGPKHIGPNLLLSSSLPTSTSRSFLSRMSGSSGGETPRENSKEGGRELNGFDGSLLTGFQLATYSGPLCAEPVVGMAYVVEDFSLTQAEKSKESVEEEGSDLASATGQVITMMREACKQAFLRLSPRLMLAMYTCDIQATTEILGKVYAVVGRRKGRIISEEMDDGTSFFNISALLPVVESFGFADDIRKKTSGAASPMLVFTGYQMLEEDPFWVPTTEEELEDLGEKADRENLAKKNMDAVRRRKGMFVENKIVEKAEKQRTLKK